MTEQEAVYLECQSARADGREIGDGCARVIAHWYHGGQSSLGYLFASTGAISSPSDVWRDLTDQGKLYSSAHLNDRQALDMLGTYLLAAGSRGPVAGWSNVWVGR